MEMTFKLHIILTQNSSGNLYTLSDGSTVADVRCWEYILTYFTMSQARLTAKLQV